jgi:N-acetylneuraminic acid mutarotase
MKGFEARLFRVVCYRLMKLKGFFRAGLLSLISITLVPSLAGASDYLIWKNLSRISPMRFGVATCVFEGKVYAFGGYNPGMPGAPTDDVNFLNLATGELSDYPSTLNMAREGAGAVSYNGSMYVVGGLDAAGFGSPNTEFTTPSVATTWDNWTVGPMGGGHGYMGTAIVGSVVYVFGGINGAKAPTATIEKCDLSAKSPTWSGCAGVLTIPKFGVFAAAVGTKVYLVGGSNAGQTNQLDIYDTVADSVTPGPSLPSGISFAAGGVIDGKIFVLPNWIYAGTTPAIYVFDPAANKWSTVDWVNNMVTTGGSYVSGTRRSAAVIGRKMYVIGGDGLSMIDEITDLDFSVNAPKKGKIQIRNNIIGINRPSGIANMKAFIVITGEAGKTYSLALYSRAGLFLGNLVDGGTIGPDGSALVVFDGTIKDKKLKSGAYWVVGGNAVADRQPLMVINEK